MPGHFRLTLNQTSTKRKITKASSHLYAVFTASTNDLAHIDIDQNKVLIGVDILLFTAASAPVAGDLARGQVSFASVMQDTNDANGIICDFGVNNGFTTSGSTAVATNKFVGPIFCPVKSGDRIYLNVTEAGSSSWTVHVTLHFRPS